MVFFCSLSSLALPSVRGAAIVAHFCPYVSIHLKSRLSLSLSAPGDRATKLMSFFIKANQIGLGFGCLTAFSIEKRSQRHHEILFQVTTVTGCAGRGPKPPDLGADCFRVVSLRSGEKLQELSP